MCQCANGAMRQIVNEWFYVFLCATLCLLRAALCSKY